MEEVTTVGMEWITTGTEAAVSVFESTLSIITGHPLLSMLLVAGTVVPVGISLLNRFKSGTN